MVRVGWTCGCRCVVADMKPVGRTFDRGILNERLNVETQKFPKYL